MRLKIIPDWKMVTLQSYTSWAFFALTAFIIAPDLIYKFFEIDTNPRVWSALMLITVVLGYVGRFILQPKANRWRRRAIIAVIVLIVSCVSFPAVAHDQVCEPEPIAAIVDTDLITTELVIKWEGDHKVGDLHKSYQDIVGVWTICFGHTATAGPNQFKTDAQCRELLKTELVSYKIGVSAYFTPETIDTRLTPYRQAAYTSLAYNVGIRGAGKSTATRRLNKDQIAGGCEALTWWNKAGGRVVRGLVRRRSDEKAYCLRGLNEAPVTIRGMFK